MTWRNLFDELRRRRVYRVSGAYVIAAFALLQGADIVLPALGAPPAVMRVVVVLAIAGLPLAAALAWIFDVTPRGIERTDSRRRAGARLAPPVPRHLAAAGIAGVVVVCLLVAGAAWLGVRHLSAGPAPAQPEGAADPTHSSGSDASVAVLPCIDVSAGRDHEYFGDGITEEIIGELARFEGLKVISRTSVVALKGSALTLPQIADTLGVDHVVQCSIQRSGTAVRVRAQLIDPRSDTHIWSDVFDRELVGVVNMQEEIARQVGGALLVRLPALRPRVASRTPAPEAYDAYLRGTAVRRQLSPSSLQSALGSFQAAVTADPSYSPAYSGMSQVHVLWTLFGYPSELDPYVRVAAAFDLAERAIELDSTSADAWAARGHAGLRAWLAADVVLADLDRAARLAPNSAEVRLLRGAALAFAGRFDEAVQETALAVVLDPLAPGNHDFRAMSLVLARRHEEALSSARTARSLAPDFPNPLRQQARALLLLGRFDECVRLDLGPYRALHAMCLHSLGHQAQARAVIDSLEVAVAGSHPGSDYHAGGVAGDLAEFHAWIGDAAGALRWLRRSTDYSPTAQFLAHYTGTYDRVRDEPRFRDGLLELTAGIRRRVTSLSAL
jgi:TolB-like protein